MADWSKLRPHAPGVFYFKGLRQHSERYVEQVSEPVEVVEVNIKNMPPLGVAMLGRGTKFKLEGFEGIWKPIEVE